MPATDAPTLLAGSACYNNYSAQFDLLKLGLLRAILLQLDPMAATDPQTLLSDANVACYFNYGSWPLLELALLQLIAQGIGSGGGGTTGLPTINGVGSPVGVKTPTGIGQLYYQTDNPGLWVATGATNTAWLQLV